MTFTKNPEITVVVPVFNEEAVVPILYERLVKVLTMHFQCYEVILVNDGSTDRTLSEIQKICKQNTSFRYISFSRNFGHQSALSAGIDYSKGETVVLIDGDLQDPPELIPNLYNKLMTGFHVVYAKRKRRKGESFFKKITAKAFYRILNVLSDVDIPLDTGDFRIISRKVVDILKKMPEKNKFLRGQIAWLGFQQAFVEYERDKRYAGETKYSMKKMFWLAFNGITSFSNFPLQIASLLGILFSVVAFFLILYALHAKFILREVVSGWTSLMVSTMFIGGVQLLCIGVIGEYISRIAIEVRKRPDYIIEDTNFKE